MKEVYTKSTVFSIPNLPLSLGQKERLPIDDNYRGIFVVARTPDDLSLLWQADESLQHASR